MTLSIIHLSQESLKALRVGVIRSEWTAYRKMNVAAYSRAKRKKEVQVREVKSGLEVMRS